MVILTRKEKEQLVIKLASEGKTTKKIAQIAHVSLGDIGKIIRRFTGEETEYQNKDLSLTSKAFQMFNENKSRVDVAIALNLEADDVVILMKII
jgi:transposase